MVADVLANGDRHRRQHMRLRIQAVSPLYAVCGELFTASALAPARVMIEGKIVSPEIVLPPNMPT